MDTIITYICPECGERTIRASGYNGNPLCWGKCYHYFKWSDIDITTYEKNGI